MKRVILVHGWASDPQDCWLPWLKGELEQRGYLVEVPLMPNPDTPRIDLWVSALSKIANHADEETHFAGHSIGCQTILRYVESLPSDQRVGQIVCVGGWFTLTNLDKEELEIAKPWLESPVDGEKIKQRVSRVIAFFSDNDSVVPLENAKLFEQNLGAKIVIQEGKGHFDRVHHITQIPKLLDFF